MNKTERVLKLAREKLVGHNLKFRHISVIFYKGRMLCWGLNKLKTHPLSDNEYKTMHSELNAIVQAKNLVEEFDPKKAVLYNARMGVNGFLNSMPCAKCAKMIKEVNFKQVFFTNNLGMMEEYVFK